MEFLGVILFIILMVVSSSSARKKQQAQGMRQNTVKPAVGADRAPTPQAVPRESDSEALRAAEHAARDFDDALLQMRRKLENAAGPAAEGMSMLGDDECRGGSMAHAHTEGREGLDDEECFGGSMAHTHTEGVSRAAHARRMAVMDAESGDRPYEDVLTPGALDPVALRRAVVMAEVLGRPKALRKY